MSDTTQKKNGKEKGKKRDGEERREERKTEKKDIFILRETSGPLFFKGRLI